MKCLERALSDSGGDSEETGNKRNLANDVMLRYPSNLALANHVDGLNTLNRSPRRGKGSESLAGSHPAFDRSMILFHYII